MSPRRGSTRTAEIYDAIRADILAARLVPGARLRTAELCERFQVSLSVVREALSRLAEQRLVVSAPQQGFRVIALDRARLLDLTEVRVRIEGAALRWSIDRADLNWEASVVSALYTVGKTQQHRAHDAGEMTEQWAAAHARFHRVLVSACGSPLLLKIRDDLYDESELYRRWAQPLTRQHRDVHAEHTEIAEAALTRDADAAVGALERHLRLTATVLLSSEFMAESPED